MIMMAAHGIATTVFETVVPSTPAHDTEISRAKGRPLGGGLETAISVGEQQIGRQSLSSTPAFVRISALQCHPKIGQMTKCKRVCRYEPESRTDNFRVARHPGEAV